MQYIALFDNRVKHLFERLPRSWDSFFLIFTAIGDPVVILSLSAFIAVAAVFYQAPKLALSMLSVPATLVIGSILKFTVGRARPISEYHYVLRIDTYSFPSGHSSGSMIMYGLLAYIAIKLLPTPLGIPIGCVLMLLPIAIGASRIYLGVHYASDVIGGWVLGLIVLLLVIFILRPL